jgi:glycerol-1-phosphate dehydrogenase [NAD(P)+]
MIMGNLSQADPTNLRALRGALAGSDPDGKLAPIGMSRIEIGPKALGLLPEVVSDLARGKRVVLVADATPISRNGEDLKELAAQLLEEGLELRRSVIGSRREGELHADEEALAETEQAVDGTDCVVVVGSGTITDLCKDATRRRGSPPVVVVQTAASVNAFSDDMSVLLKEGTKRTVPSRWPDALLIDLPTLADAPPAMNLAGFGDLLAMWTAPADWYLASAVGMDDSYHPAPVAMLYKHGRELLDDARALGQRNPKVLDRLARLLTLSGVTLGVAGKTAPLSGTEHLVSHLLDMNAEQHDLPLAFHGAQVGVATVPVSAAWEALLSELDPAKVDLHNCFPELKAMEPLVYETFAELDPTGRIGEECWSDYSQKLARWRECRPQLEAFLADWPRHRAELTEMVLPPEKLGRALKEAGAPSRFGDLDPPASEEIAFWALRNCHLMRNRFTLADLIFFLGWWEDAFVERLFERAHSAGGGL